jgi:hypothetical protein
LEVKDAAPVLIDVQPMKGARIERLPLLALTAVSSFSPVIPGDNDRYPIVVKRISVHFQGFLICLATNQTQRR